MPPETSDTNLHEAWSLVHSLRQGTSGHSTRRRAAMVGMSSRLSQSVCDLNRLEAIDISAHSSEFELWHRRLALDAHFPHWGAC